MIEPIAHRWKYDGERSWTLTRNPPAHIGDKDLIHEPLCSAALLAEAVELIEGLLGLELGSAEKAMAFLASVGGGKQSQEKENDTPA
jgi:hypothetical protein